MSLFPTLAGRRPGMTKADTIALRTRIVGARAEILRRSAERALNGRQQDAVLALALFDAAPSYFSGALADDDRAHVEGLSEQLGIPLAHLAPEA